MQMNWADTPGWYYAVGYILACSIMAANCPRRFDFKKTVLTIACFGTVLVTAMTLLHGMYRWFFIPLMMLFIAILWGMMQIVCRFNPATSLYFTIRSFIVGEFIASMEIQVFYYVTRPGFLPLTWPVNLLCLIVIDGILTFILYHLEKRNRTVNESIQINGRELVSVVLIALAIYTSSNLSYIFERIHLSEIVITQLFTIRTLMDLGGVAILYAYHMQMGELNTRLEVQRLQDILEMQQNNYEMLRQSVSAVDQKYHDLKYQIAVLKAEAGTGEGIRYLDQMEQEIKAYEAQNKTGNKVLDTILTGKSLYCQGNWIELTSVADGHAIDFMDPMDISILFGNMLDNAIESVSKIEQKEKRLIHLAIARQKGFLRIRVENCYEEEPKFEKGVLVTSKENKKYHGFGMKSIENIVKKYGGSTTIQAENGWFELRILIPLKEH